MLLSYDEFADMTGYAGSEEQAEAAISAACALVEKYLRRKLFLQEYVQQVWFDRPCEKMFLQGYPVTEVSSLIGATLLHLDAERGIVRFAKPVCGAVTCTYTGGLNPVPAPIIQACALVATSVLQANDNGGKTLMSERLGDYQVMFYNGENNQGAQSGGMDVLSPAAKALLEPYRGVLI